MVVGIKVDGSGIWGLGEKHLIVKYNSGKNSSPFLDYMYIDEGFFDKMIWTSSMSSKYTCQSFKRQLSWEIFITPIWKAMWYVQAPLIVNSFIYLLVLGRILLTNHLHCLYFTNDHKNTCPLYSTSEEDIFHLFSIVATLTRCGIMLHHCTLWFVPRV